MLFFKRGPEHRTSVSDREREETKPLPGIRALSTDEAMWRSGNHRATHTQIIEGAGRGW